METNVFLTNLGKLLFPVLILPMRNGNISKANKAFWLAVKVLILPMRNGNKKGDFLPSNNYLFLSYLWGMETNSKVPIFFTCFAVLILPMRNGNNFCHISKYSSCIVLILPMRNGNYEEINNLNMNEKVLILPMRNGNSTYLSQNNQNLFRSYPTYEEWKL